MLIKLQFGKNDFRTVNIYRNQGVDMTVELKDGSEYTDHYDGKDTLKDLEQFIAEVNAQEDGYEGLPKTVCLSGDNDFQMSDDLAEHLNEEITDYLSDKYGYCVCGYGWELTATDIDWDTEE